MGLLLFFGTSVFAKPNIPANDITATDKNNVPRGTLQQILNTLLPTSTSVDLSSLVATGTELNVLDGISGNVTAANLNTLTGGAASDASTLHIHSTGVTADNAQLLDSIDSGQFLRSDTSDNFTSGTLTFNAGTTVNIASTVTVTVGSAHLDFNLNDATNDYRVEIDNTTTGEINDALFFNTSGTGATIIDAIDCTDTAITNCINLGANNILGNGSMTFDLNSGSATTLTFDNGGAGAFTATINGHIAQTGTGNSVFLGDGAGAADDLTTNVNTFVGYQAGNANTTGSSNTFIGASAGAVNTTGANNIFIGASTGAVNTTGSANVFIGKDAGLANTTGGVTGGGNIFIGESAGAANTGGNSSVFIGSSAGAVCTQGSNTFIGASAGASNTTGGANDSGNTFIGDQAGTATTTGHSNTFVGEDAGDSNTVGIGNTFIGQNSGQASFGETHHNTFIGDEAGMANTSGNRNTFVGQNAGAANTTGGADDSGNIFIGQEAGLSNTTGSSNTFVGEDAGDSNTTASGNTFIGQNAGQANVTGASNTFVGDEAGALNTDGANDSGNTFVGQAAGAANTTGHSNTFVGEDAGDSNTTASGNTFIGQNAGQANISGSDNIFIGDEAGLTNVAGASNTFVGQQAGFNNTGGTNGNANTFIGQDSGLSNTSGTSNTFVGEDAGNSNTTGGSNTFIGQNAGDTNTTGGTNIFIGDSSGGTNTTTSNLLYIEPSTSDTPLIGGDFAADRVGINTLITSIGATLDVGGAIQADFTGAETTAGACLSDAGTQPSNANFVSCSGAPSDIAEMYETTAGVESGDIVITSNSLVTYQGFKPNEERGKERFYHPLKGELHSASVLQKSTKPYQENLIGVVSTMPFEVFGQDIGRSKNAKNPLPLALVGRVPVKVSTENGAISIGDPITSSSTAGVGMKATKAGAIVGIALEPFSGSGVGKVMMYVMNKSFHTPEQIKKFVQKLSDEKYANALDSLVDSKELLALVKDGKSISILKTLVSLYGDSKDKFDISQKILNKNERRNATSYLSTLSDEELERLLEQAFIVDKTLVVGGEIAHMTKTENHGERVSFADTSTRPTLSDRGEAQLVNGQVIIELNPVFLELVEISSTQPMQVQVTPTSIDVQGVLVAAERGTTHFTVLESNGGKSNATFSWEVTAFRKSFSQEALPTFEKFQKEFLDKK